MAGQYSHSKHPEQSISVRQVRTSDFHTELFGIVEYASRGAVDTFDPVGFTVVFGGAYQIGAGPVKRYRVKRARIPMSPSRGSSGRVTVAVHRKIVGHTDVESYRRNGP